MEVEDDAAVREDDDEEGEGVEEDGPEQEVEEVAGAGRKCPVVYALPVPRVVGMVSAVRKFKVISRNNGITGRLGTVQECDECPSLSSGSGHARAWQTLYVHYTALYTKNPCRIDIYGKECYKSNRMLRGG